MRVHNKRIIRTTSRVRMGWGGGRDKEIHYDFSQCTQVLAEKD